MTDYLAPSGTTIEKIGSTSSINGRIRTVVINNVPMELIEPFDTEPNLSHAEWQSQCVAAMTLWKTTIEDIWPGLTVNFDTAPNSINGGDEQFNQIPPGAEYDLPHSQGLGDIRFGMHGPRHALAHAHWPKAGKLNSKGGIWGDVHFDQTDPWRLDSDGFTTYAYSIAKVALHELGHVLGLPHNCYYCRSPNVHEFVENEALQQNVMYPSAKHNDPDTGLSFGPMTMDDDTKDALKALYEAEIPWWNIFSQPFTELDAWEAAWYRWQELADAVKIVNEGGTATVTFWYSYMHEGIPVDVQRIPGCCNCCGTQQANARVHSHGTSNVPADGEGHACYCGCCPCKPEGNLEFRMIACETILPEKDADGSLRKQVCSSMGLLPDGSQKSAMKFTMSKFNQNGEPNSGCHQTQQYVNQNDNWTTWMGRSVPATRLGCLTTGPGGIYSGSQYTDTSRLGEYEEAWGFSGTVCQADIEVPDRPAWTFGGDNGAQCLGMSISASLCCCKTGTDNDYMKGLCTDVSPGESCWPGGFAFIDQWTPDIEYVAGDLVRVYEEEGMPYKNPDLRYKTNPVWEWVSKDERTLLERQAHGFVSTLTSEDPFIDGAIIWRKVYDRVFEGHECPPELRDDGLKLMCPQNKTVRNMNDEDWRTYMKDCLKTGFNEDGTRNPDGGYPWKYYDPVDGKEYGLHNLPNPNNPLECSIDCFSFNIRPNDDHYEYEYLKPVKADGVDGRPLGNCGGEVEWPHDYEQKYTQWAMTTGTAYSACSPCSYKQGECSAGIGYEIFDPTVVTAGTLWPLPLSQILNNAARELEDEYGEGHFQGAESDAMGFVNIISGQCKDHDPKNPQYFKLLVAGAFEINCDCQTGIVDGLDIFPPHKPSKPYGVRGNMCATRDPANAPNVDGEGYSARVDCITEDGCQCLGSPTISIYGRTLYLAHSLYPCFFWPSPIPQPKTHPEPQPQVCLPDGSLCWYTACNHTPPFGDPSYCVPAYRTAPPDVDENGDLTGEECTGASWTTLDWRMGGVPGQIARYQGYPAKIAGGCGGDDRGGERRCWFNYKTCPTYRADEKFGDGEGTCGDNVAPYGYRNSLGSNYASWDEDSSIDQHGALSCGCYTAEEGEVSTQKCASFCEKATPVYMFFTGIIEEMGGHYPIGPPHQKMCRYRSPLAYQAINTGAPPP